MGDVVVAGAARCDVCVGTLMKLWYDARRAMRDARRAMRRDGVGVATGEAGLGTDTIVFVY